MSESLHIVCPHCHTTNRVAATRLEESPSCGKCHQDLFTGQPVDLDEAAFDRHTAHNDIPVLVDFWAPWCGPCHMMAPEFAKAAQALEPHVRLVKIDTEAQPGLARRFGIRSIPTMALMQGGREIARQSGAAGAAAIVQWTRTHSAGKG